MRLLKMLLVLFVCAAGPAVAEPLEDARAAYNKGDYAAAAAWYRKAADQGNAGAQSYLGVMYDKGQGVPQDYQQAVFWYGKAADQGDARAQNNLGVMYGTGRGVPQDYVQAHKWFNVAAVTGYANAIKGRDIVAAEMTPAQIAEAQKLAREWKPK